MQRHAPLYPPSFVDDLATVLDAMEASDIVPRLLQAAEIARELAWRLGHDHESCPW